MEFTSAAALMPYSRPIRSIQEGVNLNKRH
jgi:hypothetical protein